MNCTRMSSKELKVYLLGLAFHFWFYFLNFLVGKLVPRVQCRAGYEATRAYIAGGARDFNFPEGGVHSDVMGIVWSVWLPVPGISYSKVEWHHQCMTILHFTNSCPGLLNEGVHSLFIDHMSLILKYPILHSQKNILY